MATGRQGTKTQQPAEQEFDPKYEWQESPTSFILRLHLSGFRKEDFKVQVDGAGRLTVRGQRAVGGGKQSSFKKTFQLPQASNLDGITGRFDTGVLTLTVPKKVVENAKPKEDATKAPPPPQEQGKPKEHEAKKPQAAEHKEAAEVTAAKKPKDDAKPKEDATKAAQPPQEQGKPKEHEAKKPQAAEHKEAAEVTAAKKPKDDAKPKEDATITAPEQPVDAKRAKPEPEMRKPQAPAPPATVSKEEEPKPTAEAAAPLAPAADKKQATAEATAPAADKKQATPTPPQADAERKKAIDPESLAAVTAKRRAEEEKAAAAAEEAERQRTRRGLRERVQEDLEGLAGSEWAEGLLETVKKNKEVIAAAVAAFSLGLFASRLFSRN